MRRGFATITMIVALAACREHDSERMTAIKNQVCACTTVHCAEQAIDTVPQQAIKSTHRTQLLAREALDCLARLQTAELPSTDPDEQPSAPK